MASIAAQIARQQQQQQQQQAEAEANAERYRRAEAQYSNIPIPGFFEQVTGRPLTPGFSPSTLLAFRKQYQLAGKLIPEYQQMLLQSGRLGQLSAAPLFGLTTPKQLKSLMQGGFTERQRNLLRDVQSRTRDPFAGKLGKGMRRLANLPVNPFAGALGQRLKYLSNPKRQDVTEDPITLEMIDAAIQPMREELYESVLPQIRSQAIESGGLGGTRAGLAGGLAADRFSRSAMQARAQILGQRSEAARDSMLNALNLAGQQRALNIGTRQAALGLGAQREALQLGTRENLLNFIQGARTTGRSQALQFAGARAAAGQSLGEQQATMIQRLLGLENMGIGALQGVGAQEEQLAALRNQRLNEMIEGQYSGPEQQLQNYLSSVTQGVFPGQSGFQSQYVPKGPSPVATGLGAAASILGMILMATGVGAPLGAGLAALGAGAAYGGQTSMFK